MKNVSLTRQSEDEKRRSCWCTWGGWRVAGFSEEKQERSPRNRNELASEERMLGRRRDLMVR